MKTRILCILVCALFVILGLQVIVLAVPVGSGFTYNGRLEQNNNPPTAFFDFEFALFDDPNGIEGSEVAEFLFFEHLTSQYRTDYQQFCRLFLLLSYLVYFPYLLFSISYILRHQY